MAVETIQLIATAAGSAILAATGVWWFLVRRELDPGSEMTIDLNFSGRQDNQVLLEVVATLTNKGSVQQRYYNFRANVRYLRAADRVIDGPRALDYQLLFPNSIDSRIHTVEPEGRKVRLFGHSVYINPKLCYRHSYVTSVPGDATFILVHCGLLFEAREKWYSIKRTSHVKNQQRLFRVPEMVDSNYSGGTSVA